MLLPLLLPLLFDTGTLVGAAAGGGAATYALVSQFVAAPAASAEAASAFASIAFLDIFFAEDLPGDGEPPLPVLLWGGGEVVEEREEDVDAADTASGGDIEGTVAVGAVGGAAVVAPEAVADEAAELSCPFSLLALTPLS